FVLLEGRSMKAVRYCIHLACALLLWTASPLKAQTAPTEPVPVIDSPSAVETSAGGQIIRQPAGPPPTPRHTWIKAMIKDLGQDVIHLPSKENLFWAGAGGGLALAAHPFDDNVTPSLVDSNFADKFFKAGEVLGESPTLFGAAIATYAVGRIG